MIINYSYNVLSHELTHLILIGTLKDWEQNKTQA